MRLLEHTQASLLDYTCAQLANFFPSGDAAALRRRLERSLPRALERLAHCLGHVRMWEPGQFNYLNSSQYCIYLYYLANTVWREHQDADSATRLFLLNKALNGIDLFYEIEMPEVFFIGHSVGIVLAKASYGNYLVLYQNATVGKNHGVAPVLGDGVILYPNSAIIGRCNIGNNTVVSQGTGVVNRDTPGDCLVFPGNAGDLTFNPLKRPLIDDFFRS
jgi:serine O-acetyltransferase